MELASLRERNIESELIEALQPIRNFVLAASIYHLFQSGIYDLLSNTDLITVQRLASELGFDQNKVEGLAVYLKNEGILQSQGPYISLTHKGHSLSRFRGWYTMLIGGYGQTYLEIGNRLAINSGWASRDATQVGIGSCGISHYDSIPLTRSLMQSIPSPIRTLLDLGCGNGLYLVEFCKLIPEITALGIEKDQGACEEGRKLIQRSGLSHRVTLTCAPVLEYLREQSEFTPDLTVLGFVLHEILAQEGRSAVIELLASIVTRFPDIHLIVIEVDDRFNDPSIMRHRLSEAYYNAYYLMHYFTCQKLETRVFWCELFDEAGLELVAEETTKPSVDSTGLEIGFLLRRSQS